MDLSKILLLLALLIVAFIFNDILKIFLLVCLALLLMIQIFPNLFTFHQKEKMPEQSEKDDNEEQEWFDDLTEELNLVNRTLGYPNDDQFSVLLSLFNVRCCIIAQLYNCIRNYQDDTMGGEHWIKKFLNDYASCPVDEYGLGEEKLDNLKKKAEEVFNADYNKSFSAPTKCYRHQVQGIMLSLYYWEFSPLAIIKILDGISSFGFFNDMLTQLVHEYMEIDRLTRSGDFETIYMQKHFEIADDKKAKLWQKTDIDKAVEALERSNKIWDQIFSLFKISIIQRNIKVKNLSEEDLLQQLSSLKYMEKHIDWAILQAGKESNSLGGGLPNPETEKSFFAKAESNPFVNNYSWSV